MDYLPNDRHQRLAEAVRHLKSALDLLDSAAAPAQIGAHVDLAIHQIEAELCSAGQRRSGTG